MLEYVYVCLCVSVCVFLCMFVYVIVHAAVCIGLYGMCVSQGLYVFIVCLYVYTHDIMRMCVMVECMCAM